MRRLLFNQLTRDDLTSLVKLDDQTIGGELWDSLAQGELTEAEHQRIAYVVESFERVPPLRVNEATVWSRAIFPLLALAETPTAVAMADVALIAQIRDVELAGSADGAFGTREGGGLRAPFLIVVETKRGIEGSDPVNQLYGELLAAACLNAKDNGRPAQRVYGCFTVAAFWTFVRADVEGLDTDRPSLTIATSLELAESSEAATIVKILKSIIALHSKGQAANDAPIRRQG
jgi:hypothetical protein